MGKDKPKTVYDTSYPLLARAQAPYLQEQHPHLVASDPPLSLPLDGPPPPPFIHTDHLPPHLPLDSLQTAATPAYPIPPLGLPYPLPTRRRDNEEWGPRQPPPPKRRDGYYPASPLVNR
jgi:hypothetical protein